MTTITEDYVSFEIAKLLKEKGFNPLECGMYYSIETGKKTTELLTSLIACPTLQMARKWLRKIYEIDIVIDISDPSVKDRKYYCMIWDGNNNSHILDLFNSYEQACEAAIKYCLEHLI